ncbi:methyl-accepting chemotaxis protein [Dyella acidiphila]|uniref:MCP four helix bundle domain-containing protein n=1 Tax=Dyella acidiphila TaxID=2775866 RepID=A0ABR9GG18_9GAMM|nr:methyl-accepting chemotaxis protein [Dyella acidiphila]MBE1163001.1 MCP four helix bundle domain-containing protein [Dyella acidiphila]
MKRRFSLTIRHKLILGLSLCALIMVGIGCMGIYGQSQSNGDISDIYEGDVKPILDIGRVRNGLSQNLLALNKLMLTHDAKGAAQAKDFIAKSDAGMNEAWGEYYPLIDSARERQAADAVAAARKQIDGIAATVLSDAAQGKFDVDTLAEGGAYAKLFTTALENVDVLYSENQDQAEESYKSAEDSFRHTRMFTIGIIAGGFLIIIGLLVAMLRAISKPIERAVVLADAIASGQLNHGIKVDRQDEVGRLMLGLSRMDEQLTRIVKEVRGSASSVATASSQIAQGNDDLSHRTQEQASSLEETAASMEQMNATVRQNAESANQTSQLALGALEHAEHGGRVAGEAVNAMLEIEASSKRIAEISGLIDEIAFQTNLLALNAAVEAARAGEEGRGFAVVAGEVRVLAQRSAGAAREIKLLINESSEKVQTGASLVNASGEALSQILDRTRKITDLVAEIAAASTEQATGVEQVNTTVTALDDMTQRNAALVEEAAAASRALQEQAGELMQHVNFFRISGADEPAVQVATAVKRAVVAATPAKAKAPAKQAAVAESAWREF